VGGSGPVGRTRRPRGKPGPRDREDRVRAGVRPQPERRQPGLTAYGCGKIFTDTASGKHAARPELGRALLACLREGDVLVITRLSRAMRSPKHLLALAGELRER